MATMSVTRWVISVGAVVAIVLLALTGRQFVQGQQTASASLHDDAIVVDGHTHITNRVFWEGIDPWTAQASGRPHRVPTVPGAKGARPAPSPVASSTESRSNRVMVKPNMR